MVACTSCHYSSLGRDLINVPKSSYCSSELEAADWLQIFSFHIHICFVLIREVDRLLKRSVDHHVAALTIALEDLVGWDQFGMLLDTVVYVACGRMIRLHNTYY